LKTRKLLLSILTVIMFLVCIFTITSSAATEDDTIPTLNIPINTLELKNTVYMNFKVESTNIDDTSNILLLAWDSLPTEYTKETAEYTLTAIRTESDTGRIVFQYDNLSAKDMTKFIYVCAYANVNGEDIYSKPVKFSIIQYAYNMLNDDSTTAELKELLVGMLEYGALAQNYFAHNTDFLATDEVAKIKVVNGTHADGFKTGYYKAGTNVTLTANEANEGYVFSHWVNSTENVVGTETTLTITECASETYTAIYTNDTIEGVQYRYRDRKYTTSNTKLDDPWVLYDQITEIEHGSTIKVYLEENESIDTEKYCVHYKNLVCKYMHPTNSTYKWVNSSSTDHYYYHIVGDTKYWHYDDYYCYTCCSVSSKTSSTEYYYYSWGDWSEWSDTPIVATNDREVEIRGVFFVNYDANDGENAPETQTKALGESISITFDEPTRDGYKFKGWSTSNDGTVEYNSGDIYTNDTSITLYAVWETTQTTITLSYDANGGNGAPSSETVEQGISISISSTIPVREGFTFLGWSTNSAGSMYSTSNNGYDNVTNWRTSDGGIGSYSPTYWNSYSGKEDLTLYAVWQVNDSTALGNKCGDNLYWSYDPDTYSLAITGYGPMYNFVDAPWNEYKSKIRQVYLPEGLLSIGNNAFAYCAINTITIPNTVLSIGSGAFRCNASLKLLVIPSSVKQVCFGAFSDCDYLTDVTIEYAGLIDKDTFYSCDRLNKVSIVGNVTRIISNAFNGCEITHLELPKSLTWITTNSIENTVTTNIYYCGTEELWVDLAGTKLSKVTIYYYSVNEPDNSGNFWHYDDDGNPVVW